MATDKNGKLTYQMKSPGDAWMDHVESNMGASKATPAWADKTSDNSAIQKQMADLNKKVDAIAKEKGQDVNQEPEKEKAWGVSQIDKLREQYREKQNKSEKEQPKEKKKEKEKEKEPSPKR